jgi:hypothetical protein
MFRLAVSAAWVVLALAAAGCSDPSPAPVTPAVSAPGPLTGNSETICDQWSDLHDAYNSDDPPAAKAYFAAQDNGTSGTKRAKIEYTYFHEQAKAVWNLAKRADDPRLRTALTTHMDQLNAEAAGRTVTTDAARDVMMTCWPA